MSRSPQSADAGRNVLANHTGHAAAPDVADAVGDRQIGMICLVAWNVSVPAGDIGAEIRRSFAMVHPDLQAAVVTGKLVEGAASVGPGGGQVPVRVQTVDVAAMDQGSNHLATGIIGVPVRELFGRHVEVD